MHSIITSYLMQTGACALPHLGVFTTRQIPAVMDEVNNEILPPKDEIIFEDKLPLSSPALVSYIALQKNIPEAEAGNLLDAFCKKCKERIAGGETLCFDGFGCLQKNGSGAVYFTADERVAVYYQPVKAARIVHESNPYVPEDEKEALFAGATAHHGGNQVTIARKKWLLPAVMLAAVTLIILFYSLYGHTLSVSAIGNRNQFTIKDAERTYYVPDN